MPLLFTHSDTLLSCTIFFEKGKNNRYTSTPLLRHDHSRKRLLSISRLKRRNSPPKKERKEGRSSSGEETAERDEGGRGGKICKRLGEQRKRTGRLFMGAILRIYELVPVESSRDVASRLLPVENVYRDAFRLGQDLRGVTRPRDVTPAS